MKRATLILFALGLILTVPAKAQTNTAEKAAKINWVTIEEAEKLQAKEPRKIMVDFYTEWCGPCKMMSKYTFTDAKFVEYVNANYYAVKFNAEGGAPVNFNGREFLNPNFDPNRGARSRNSAHQLTRAVQITGYPTVVVFDEKKQILKKMAGFRPADTLLPILKTLNQPTGS